MAALTRQCEVFPGQFENRLVVVKRERGPICGGVTVAAQWAEIAAMFVICRMAGIAVSGYAFIDGILMAALTGGGAVLPG